MAALFYGLMADLKFHRAKQISATPALKGS
jgi:hypothetical protein